MLSWRSHVDRTNIPTLNASCYTIRVVKPFMSQGTLKMVYYSYSINIFRLQNRIIRITMAVSSRDSCREFFKKLQILPFPSQYVYSLLLFVVSNKDHYKVNSEIHSINTKQYSNFYQSLSNLTTYQMVPVILASRFLINFLLI